MKETRAKLDDDVKSAIRNADIFRKKEIQEKQKAEIKINFKNIQACSMVDPCILNTQAFKLVEKEFKTAIQEGPTYTCHIC